MEGFTTKDTIGIPAKPSDFVGGGYVGGGGIKSIKFGAILGIPKPFSSMMERFNIVESSGLWFRSAQEDTALVLDNMLVDESRLEELLKIRARWGPSDVLITA